MQRYKFGKNQNNKKSETTWILKVLLIVLLVLLIIYLLVPLLLLAFIVFLSIKFYKRCFKKKTKKTLTEKKNKNVGAFVTNKFLINGKFRESVQN